MAFKTICVDHVGIACAGTLEEAAKIYTEVLGLKATGTEEVKEQGVATVFVPCGETLIEHKAQLHHMRDDGDGLHRGQILGSPELDGLVDAHQRGHTDQIQNDICHSFS